MILKNLIASHTLDGKIINLYHMIQKVYLMGQMSSKMSIKQFVVVEIMNAGKNVLIIFQATNILKS